MVKTEVEREVAEAEALARMGHRANYWRGYAQGVRWASEGRDSGDAHAKLVRLAADVQARRRDSGLGYLAGVERVRGKGAA